VDMAFEGIEDVWDMHTHLGGVGHGASGCCVHPNMQSPWLHPINAVKYKVFLSSAGVASGSKQIDEDYADRLALLIRSVRPYRWAKHFLLALDHWYDVDGRRRDDLTGLYTPNDYMMSICEKYPDCFVPCISVHPFRPDAIEQLDYWGKKGVRLLKWLPNAQGIIPSHEKCTPFYAKMKEYGMVLLCHVGEEHSIDFGGIDQSFGNPLHLRKPLEAGVKVIAAHCASEGHNKDLEDPALPTVLNFHLFLRLMDDERYKDLFFADISAMTAFKRLGVAMTTMLDRPDLHDRLVFGSDYPVPCINIVVQTSSLVKWKYITEEERSLLNEIYDYNPLLFDFVTKRCLKSPDTGRKFSKCVFNWNTKLLGPKPQ